MTKVLYPASFDPITKGHISVMEQASLLFDEVVIAVLQNSEKKNPFFTREERLEILLEVCKRWQNVSVTQDSGLAVDVAERNDCIALVRGMRSLTDYDYEVQLEQTNKEISDGRIHTVCFFADKEFQFVSSSMVKEVFSYGKDVSRYVEPLVLEKMLAKRKRLSL